MTARPANARAVMCDRREARDSDDFFPTPPWAARALCAQRIVAGYPRHGVWEPAAGRGDLVKGLRDAFEMVLATDIHPRAAGIEALDFLGGWPPHITHWLADEVPPWVITNPPYNLADAFVVRALDGGVRRLAMLLPLNWLAGGRRYERLFTGRYRPDLVLVLCERPAILRGRLLRRGADGARQTTATNYAWVIWERWAFAGQTLARPVVHWIPPGARAAHEKFGDYDDDEDGPLMKMMEGADG